MNIYPDPRSGSFRKVLVGFLLIVCSLFVNSNSFGQYQRVYATTTSTDNLGVDNPNLAIDGNLSTYSTVQYPLIGSHYQQLNFPTAPTPGTPVHIKLGTATSLLNLITGGSIQAYNNNTAVGQSITIGSLLSLISGQNQGELVFTPVDGNNQPVAYNAIRVTTAAVLSVGGAINIYEAYYNIPATSTVVCDNPIDILWGASGGVLGGVNQVTNPMNAVDGNLTTYTQLRANVSVAASVHLDLIYPALSKPGDSVRIVLRNSNGGLLDLGVLSTLSVHTFNNGTDNGAINLGDQSLIKLSLLSPGGTIQVASFAVPQAFDKISIQLGGLATALAGADIFEIQRMAASPVIQTPNPGDTAISTCVSTPVTLNIQNPQAGVIYNWYNVAQGGTPIQTGTSLSLPGFATSGTYRYYVTAIRNGCSTESARGGIALIVSPSALATDITVTGVDTVCGGNNAVLKPVAAGVTSPVFKWYLDAAKTQPITSGTTGGITYAIATDGTLTVTGITANTTYYVSVSGSNKCENAANALKAVNVVAAAKPAAPSVAAAVAVQTGVAATLQASTTATTGTIVWYDGSGNQVGTGTSVQVGPFSTAGTYTYFATVRLSGGGCESDKAQVTVTVSGPNTPPSGCNFANSQQSGTTLGCILCNVANPNNSVDNDSTNYTTLSMPAGLLGGSVYQVLNFGQTGNATDSIQLDLNFPGGLADLSVLGGSQITVLNGTSVVSTYQLSNLLTLRLLGGQRFRVRVPAGGAYTAVKVELTGVINLLVNLQIYGARIIYPNPTAITGSGSSVCAGSTATLSATPATGTTIRWYNVASGGTVLSNANSFTTAPLTTPGVDTFYIEVVGTNTCANPDRVPVAVLVKALGTAANIKIDSVSTCVNASAVLKPAAVNVSNPVFLWYQNADKTGPITNGAVINGATYTIAADGTLTIAGLPLGSYDYYVSVSGDSTCENAAGSLKPVNVKVATKPATAKVGGDVSVGIGTPVTLKAQPVAGATIQWYDSPTATTPVATGTSYTVGPFTTAGTHTYYASVLITGGCESDRVAVNVIVTDGSNPNTDCNVPTSQISGTTLGCVLCSITNPGAPLDNDPNNFSKLNLPVGLLGGSIYQQLIFAQPGAASDSIRVVIGVPTGLADVSLLGGSLISVMNGNQIVRTDTLSKLLTLRLLSSSGRDTVVIPAGATYDRVQISLTGVVNLINNLSIYGARVLYANPTLDPKNPPSVCNGSAATLNVIPAAGTTVNWYADSTTTTPLLVGSNTYKTQAIQADSVFYVAAVGANGCINPVRVPIRVVVTTPATAADITVKNDSICGGSSAIIKPTSTTVTQPVFLWYKDQNRATAITDGLTDAGGVKYAVATDGTLTITGLAASATPYTYYVSVSGSNKCQNAAGTLASANVLASSKPDTLKGPDVYAQTGTPVNLAVTSSTTGGIVYWYTSPTGTDTAGTGNPLVKTFNTPGTYDFYPALHLPGGCESDRGLIHAIISGPFNPNPNCNNANSQTAGTTPVCLLCNVTNPNNDIDSDTTNYTTLHMPAGALGGSVYQVLGFGRTGNVNDTVLIDIDFPGGLADVSLAAGAKVTLLNNNAVVSTTTISNLLTVRLLGGQRYILKVPAPAAYNSVKVELTGLLNLLLNLNIHGARIIVPNPVVVPKDTSTCVGGKITLNATAAPNTTLRWYTVPTGGDVKGTGNSYTTDVLTTPGVVTYYIEVVSNGNDCPNPNRIPVNVTVSPAPAPPAVQASNVAVCSGASAVLSVLNPVTGHTYNWYTVATGGTQVGTGTTYTVASVTGPATYYVETVNDTCGAVSATRTAVSVNVASALDVPTVTQVPNPVGVGQQAQLTATSTTANADFVWIGGPSGTDTLQKTGAVYIVQNAQPGQVFKVFATLKGGTTCRSADLAVNVNAVVVPPGPGPCEGASSQSIGGSGLLVLGNVYNPQLAIDQDTTTGSSLVINLGALNATVWQRVGFKGLSTPGDTLHLTLAAPSQVLSAALLGGLQITTFSGSTAQDSVLVNDPLIKLTLLSNNHLAKLELVPAKQFDSVQLTLKSGLLSALTNINFNYAQRIIAKPTVKDTALTICSNGTATLQVQNPVAGITYRWYNSSGAYLTGKDGTSYTTGALTASTTYYVEAFRAAVGCASSTRTAITVNVKPQPAAPTVGSNNVKVCPGTSAELTVNKVSGIQYGWYNVATGGTKLNTDSGFVYKVTVTGPATYYVEAIDDSCGTISATRTAVAVDVASSLTAPTVTPSPATVVIGQQAVLTANAGIANVNYFWYGSQSGTDTLQKTGSAIFAAPAQTVTGSKTYWVNAVLQGGGSCQSDRTPVTVNTTNGSDNGPCEGAIAQSIGGSGLLVLGNVYNPQLAIDKDTTTGSSLVINLGALNATVWQRVGFQGLSTVGDTVRLTLESPSQVLSASLLGGLQVSTYNGSAQQESFQLNNPLIKISLLTNNKQAKVEFVPTLPFDSVQLTMNSGLLTALTSINLNYAQRVIAKPQVEATSTTACKGTPALLKVKNPVSGIVYSWYDDQGNHLKDSVAYYTPANLAPGDHNYIVKAVRNSCASAGTTVKVTVQNIPDQPVPSAGNPASVCIGSAATLKVDPATDPSVTFNWYDAATGGNLLAPNTNSYATSATLPAGTYNYYVEAVSTGGCASTSGRVKITLNITSPSDSTDIAANGTTICAGSTATLTASSTTVTNPTFSWYADAGLTKLLTTGNSYTTSALRSDSTYYVTVQGDNKCATPAGKAKAVVVHVNSASDSTDITANGTTICAGSNATLTASSATVTNPTFSWYADAGLTKLLVNGSSYTTSALTSDSTYYVTVQGDNKCATPSGKAKTVVVHVSSASDSTDITANGTAICAGSTATLTAGSTTVTNPTFSWYADAGLTKLLVNGSSYTTSALTSDSTYYVTVQGDNKCATPAGKAKAVVVHVNTQADSTDIVANGATVCSGSTATLTASSTTVTNPTFSWYADAGLTKLLVNGSTYTTSALTSDSTYYITVTGDNKCGINTSKAKIVHVNVRPPSDSTDIAANGATICAGSDVTLTASSTTVTSPQFSWYSDAALTQLVSSTSSLALTKVTATATYYVTVSGANKCTTPANAAKKVTVTVTTPSTPADVMVNDTTICSGSSVTLTASTTTVTNPVFAWYKDAALSQLVSNTNTYSPGALTADATYYVTVSGSNKCAGGASSAKPVNVRVRTSADSTDITARGATICAKSPVTLTASSTTVTNPRFTWYSDAGLTHVVSTQSFLTVDTLSSSTTYYVTVSGDNKCNSNAASSGKAVVVFVNPAPGAPVVAPDGTTACKNQSTTLSVKDALTSIVYTWYDAASGGNLLQTGSSFATPPITANTTYYVQAANGTCISGTRTRVDVTAVDRPTAPTIAASGTTACQGTNTTLSVNNPQANLVYNWYDAATGGTLLETGTTYTTNPLNANTTFYVEAAYATGCNSADRASVTVTVNAAPAAPTVASANLNVCAGGTAILQVSNPQSGYTYNWYSVSTGGAVLFSGPNYTVNNITVSTVYYVAAVNATGCSSTTRASVNVNVLPAPATPSVANSTPVICSGSTVTLTATSATAGATFNWYSSASGSTVVATGSSFTTGPITSDTAFYVAAVNPNGCTSTTRAQAVITILRPLPAPTVTVTGTTATSVTFGWQAITGATGYQVTTDGGTTYVSPSSGPNGLSHTISGLQPNQTVSIQVRALSTNACQIGILSAKVSGTATNPLGNDIYVPNVFTPNSDGKNDFFKPYGNAIASAEMWIYSQWGNALFHTSDGVRGWDGTAGNKPQPVGVYIYIIKITLQDGTVVTKKGSVNLIR